MKKGTAFLLAVVFLVSVLVVGFFGMEAFSYTQNIYVEEIRPTDVITSDGVYLDYQNSSDGDNIFATQAIYSEGLVVMVGFDIFPADATNRKVKLELSGGNPENPAAVLESNGAVRFLRQTPVELTVRARDGSRVFMTMRIYV